ncbi:MAG: competence type IV pilus major pilin ComGC [Candidatus Brocadiia bacterium]
MFHNAIHRRRRGFTLLELLIVVVILGILAAVIVPRFTVSAAEAKKNACAQNVANINTQVERWYFEKGSWPASDLSDIGSDADYFPDGLPTCPVDGSAYALDATTHRVTGHSH